MEKSREKIFSIKKLLQEKNEELENEKRNFDQLQNEEVKKLIGHTDDFSVHVNGPNQVWINHRETYSKWILHADKRIDKIRTKVDLPDSLRDCVFQNWDELMKLELNAKPN